MTDIDDGDTLDRVFCRRKCTTIWLTLYFPGQTSISQNRIQVLRRKTLSTSMLADDLNSTNEVPFVLGIDKRNNLEYHFANLVQRYFRSMQDFIDTIKSLSPMYEYNEHINVFTRCCASLGLLDATTTGLISGARRPSFILNSAE